VENDEHGSCEAHGESPEGWQAAGHHVLPGTSGVSFRTMVQDKSWWIFRALTPNRLTFPRNGWLERGMPKQAIDEFFAILATISGPVRDKIASQSEPNLYVDELSDADAAKILEAALRLVRRWNESLAHPEPDAALPASA